MSINKKAFKTAIRGLGRAFRAKDERGFEEALDDMEEVLEESGAEDGEEPDTVEVHNHIPDTRSFDTARGELPEKDPPGFDNRMSDDEPPWFKKHREETDKRFKSMSDSIENLTKGSAEDDFGGETAEEENLEMEDGVARDEPSEREEMAEPIRENGGGKDKRQKDRRDEANKAILGELEYEAPPGTGDKARRAKDSAYLEDSFQDAVSKAEIVAPGIALPTFDKAAAPIKTAQKILTLRKTALDLAYAQPATRGIIDDALSGRTFDAKRTTHGQARVLFNVLAAQVGNGNNQRATDRSSGMGRTTTNTTPQPRVQSIADLNKINREKAAAGWGR
jgi:hypothetical protein